jgi:dihydroflavonol-4-reductase
LIVVTGAAGHVGNVLVRTLLAAARGPVRAMVHQGGNSIALAELEVEILSGDVLDPASLAVAFEGADLVFHTAGVVSITNSGLKRLRRANVEGTRNVLAACRASGVRRLVYTSSVHAFVEPPAGACTTENSPIDPVRSPDPYAKTKAEATLLVLQAARQGLEAVVAYPSGIVGPHDYKPSHTGQLVLDHFHRRLLAYVDGAYDFVDVRDVAQGLIAAADRGRSGEGYILAGHVITVIDLLRELERLSGVPAPRLRLPMRVARTAGIVAPAYYRLRRQRPLFTTYSVDVINSNHCMDRGKAERELSFAPRPLTETLDDTLRWFRRQGVL